MVIDEVALSRLALLEKVLVLSERLGRGRLGELGEEGRLYERGSENGNGIEERTGQCKL